MDDYRPITRRSFLATGLLTSVAAGLSGRACAVSSVSAHCEAIGKWIDQGHIGSLVNVQFHRFEKFDFLTALNTVEYVCRKHTLEKVSALGDWEFSEQPQNVMASLYYSNGLRATVSTARSVPSSYGTVLGDKGSITLRKGGVDLLDDNGVEVSRTEVMPKVLANSPSTYPMIIKALRVGATEYPSK